MGCERVAFLCSVSALFPRWLRTHDEEHSSVAGGNSHRRIGTSVLQGMQPSRFLLGPDVGFGLLPQAFEFFDAAALQIACQCGFNT